jgi:gamma-glutamyltranspeptidase/glutathione hydrolase
MRRILACLVLFSLTIGARPPVRAKHAMVAAQEGLATDVGVAVLKSGGNAVDAAVAVGFALAVTYPFAGNIGGGGFMTIRLADGRTTFIDFRERAPGKASRDMYLDADGKPTRDSIEGWRSSGVPGSVRGFELALSKYGRLKWADVIAPAIDLASKGFPVSYALSESLRTSRSLSRSAESKRIYQKDGAFYDVDETMKLPDLAATLTRIAKNGAAEFYEGETAQKFSAEMAKNGGLITLDDLKDYKAVERKPLIGKYKNYEIITAPPPSSGGIGMLQILGMLEGSGYEKTGFGSAASISYVAEAMQRFYADRSEYFGDPDFFKVPIVGLLDPAYIKKRRETIDRDHATPSEQVKPGKPVGSEGTETTHFSVVDAEGNAVSVTYTLNGGYGNGITVPGLGFLLNNEMDDFAAKAGAANMFGLVQGEGNTIRPGKRPLSAMTPTIILRDGKLFMTVGAPGGSRIITAVTQVFLNVADFGMNVQDAVDAPRFHHQWQPDILFLEKGFSPDTIELLRQRGFHPATADPKPAGDLPSTTSAERGRDVTVGRVEAIVIDKGWLQGGSDGRAVGKAAGY